MFHFFVVVSKTQNTLTPTQTFYNGFRRIGKSTSDKTEMDTSTPVHHVATPLHGRTLLQFQRKDFLKFLLCGAEHCLVQTCMVSIYDHKSLYYYPLGFSQEETHTFCHSRCLGKQPICLCYQAQSIPRTSQKASFPADFTKR